jgi:dGTPase
MQWNSLLNPNRPRPSTSQGDHREQFERDYDRAIFSSSVKRLQDKAQVFPLEPHDAVRTRLTHSLEVSTVARGLARFVCKQLANDLEAGQDRQIEAIAATCGLLHDLGNPPFGHSGEDAIRSWFREHHGEENLRGIGNNEQLVQDLLRFEGNAQTLRIVSKLQFLADYNGLNLTFGTLSALMKYTAASHEGNLQNDKSKKKPGFFAAEAKLVERIRAETATGAARNPITYLVEAADDIVYSVADIEDGIKKGILTWATLEGLLRQQCGAAGTLVDTILNAKHNILCAGRKEPPPLPDDVHGSAFRTAAIQTLVSRAGESFLKNKDRIMSGEFTADLLTAEQDTDALLTCLKKVGSTKIYCTPSNLKLELMGRKIIHDLLTLFWEGVQELPLEGEPSPRTFAGKLGALLSENYRRVFRHFVCEQQHLPEMYHRFLLLTDYVCGMTDSFAKRLHGELTNG